MRKHFLILMLLALLPLAGWALTSTPLTGATITDHDGVNLQYVAVPTTPGIASVTLSDESAADLSKLRAKYYSFNGTEYTAIGYTAPTNAGNYAMSVVPEEGDDTYEGESNKLDFVINKIPLTIAFADVHKYVDEGDPEPSLFTFTIPTRSQLRGDDNENTIRSTFTWVTKTREAGTAVSEAGYPYTIEITATNYEVTVGTQPKLFIDRAPLTITFADASVAYGATAEAEATAIAAAYTIKDRTETAIGAELLATLVENGFVVGRETPEVINAAAYEYTFTSGNVGNYTITRATGDEHKFTINQRTIGSVAPTNCEMTGNAEVTYDATGHTRTITAELYAGQEVTFNTRWVKLDAPIPSADRQKAYQGSTGYEGKTFDNPVDAGTYYAVIKGTGNFNNYYAQDDWKITINKKPANITVKNYSTPYTGENQKTTALSKIGLSYTSLALPDVEASLDNFGGDVSVEWISEPANVINAGDYNVMAVCVADPTSAIKNYDITWGTTAPVYYANATEYNEAKGTTLDADGFAALSDEEKIKTPAAPAITGKYTITKLNVTATAQTLEYVLGSDILEAAKDEAQDVAITDENVLFEPAVLAGDLATVQAALKLQVAKREAGYTSTTEAYEGAAVLTVTAQPTNYKITPVNGSVQVSEAPLNIAVETATAEYGDKIDDIEFSYYAGGKTLTPKTGGLVYKVKKNAPETGYYTAEELIEVGTYVVELDPNSYTLPEGYKNGILDNGYLVVSKKELNIAIEPVSLNTGDGLTELQKYASVNAAYKDDLADKNADIEFTIEFSDDANLLKNYGTLVAPKLGLKSAAEYTTLQEAHTINYWDATTKTLEGVTVLSFDPAADANKNYDIHFTAGNIVLGGAKTLKIDYSDQMASKIGDAAAAGVNYNVTFGAKTMKAEEWYAIVLPFATSAYDLVKQLGQYVVINTYGDDSDPGHIKFHLQMGDIAAGVPFLIKAGAELNWDGKKFDDRLIVNAPVAQGTLADNGSVFTGVFSTGNVLLNGYELDGTTANDELAYRWLSDSDYEGFSQKKNTWRAASANDHHKRNLNALEAYLQIRADLAPARITVEDFDGQTTSIQELSAGEMKAVVADGWYTIDGIKLQSAPTQKGIYINNGKKVVLK